MSVGLDEKLTAYAKSDYYPFHMPGHKRRNSEFANPYAIDITEIDGFDNLHAANGILKEAQERAAKLYGAKKSYYLINGSTCGILAAVSAAVKRGGKILIARNCHKAVYHAAYLRQLRVSYLYPELTSAGLQGAISAKEVERALEKEADVAAVVITSPTYEGIVSDVQTIAKIVHKYKIPLIVDEAHGAHFGFHSYFPQSAVKNGADAVIQSMHKQLPCFTQTALLHLNSDRISEKEAEKYLDIYETSSPSYLFMAGMDKCIRLLEKDKEQMFDSFAEKLNDFYEKTKNLRFIKVLRADDFSKEEAFEKDASKLVLSVKNTSLTGQMLYEILLQKYHLQLEMASGFYALAMTSIMDTQEGFDRLIFALSETDNEIEKTFSEAEQEENVSDDFIRRFYQPRKKRAELYEAEEFLSEIVSFDEAVGRISADTVFLYPPGIPTLTAGEEITEEFIKDVRACKKLRLNLQGVADLSNEKINCLQIE